MLGLLCEQVAIPLDQLARFLNCARRDAARTVEGLREAGCIAQRRFLADEEAWIWATRRGAALSGTGLEYRTPTVRWLTHRRAVNEVRLHLAEREPDGRWICEREVGQAGEVDLPKPDGVFEVGGERHAIEVELSRKSRPVLRSILASHSRRYDAVVYFCSPQTRGLLEEVRRRERWPKLLVRDVPGLRPILETNSRGFGVPLRAPPAPKRVPWASPRKRPRQPQSWERDVLALICEQGAIPIDQLARFLACDRDPAQDLGEHLREAGFARTARLLAAEPEWIWLSEGGTRLSQTGLRPYLPTPGALARLRAINEVRLRVEGGPSEVRWIGWRSLRRELRGVGRIPNAVVEVGEERHAIEVELSRKEKEDAAAMIAHRSVNYDAVICFCTDEMRRFYERLAAHNHWPKLLIRALPEPGAAPKGRPPSRWRHCAEGLEAARLAPQAPHPRRQASRGSRLLSWQPAERPTRSEVDDLLWAELEELIPPPAAGSNRRRMPDRTALSGILYIARTGTNWSDLPTELGYGSGITCWERLRQWERDGAWPEIQGLLQSGLPDGERIAWARLAPQG